MPCHITFTNEKVHDLIRANLHRAPMYSGQINSRGPRYCPSIEDKIVRFADKSQHQLFLEPEGRATQEVYVNGVSTSLPRDVQDQMFRFIPGCEKAVIMRYGYAVEYDFCPPTQLWPHLESKAVEGLFFAGQINGTTGYEEAAGQGLIAGTNAACKVLKTEPFVPNRDEAYLGVLVDDLVTCGTDEPYRMFTSRAEYRLLLRQDNADRRLTPRGFELGLVDATRHARLLDKLADIDRALSQLQSIRIEGVRGDIYLRRPEVQWEQLVAIEPALGTISPAAVEQVIYDIRYEGYIDRQQGEIDRRKRHAEKRIPTTFDFASIRSLRAEAKQKLSAIRPVTIDQAQRISGITPADIALVMAHLRDH